MSTMRLKLLLPTEVLLDVEVTKVVAEAENGSFGILPRHIDFVTALVPGVLAYVDSEDRERFAGTDHGTLVKQGRLLTVATRNAVAGDDLPRLQEVVERTFMELDEHERSARTALGRLEAGIVRRFIDLQ
jgi:F-type H+-transporting ATPase subunit epsilon